MVPAAPPLDVPDLGVPEELTGLAAPVMAAAERLRLVIQTAAAEKDRATGEVRQVLLRLGSQPLEPDQRAGMARVAYWAYPEIAVRDIAFALGFADQKALTAAAGPVDSGVPCPRCQAPLRAATRSELDTLRKGGSGRRYGAGAALCDSCQQAEASRPYWEDDPWRRADDADPGW